MLEHKKPLALIGLSLALAGAGIWVAYYAPVPAPSAVHEPTTYTIPLGTTSQALEAPEDIQGAEVNDCQSTVSGYEMQGSLRDIRLELVK